MSTNLTPNQLPAASSALSSNLKPCQVPLFRVAMDPGAAEKVADVLESGYIGQGSIVEQFELELADRLRTRRVLTVNSATSGLTLALRLLVPEPRNTDEVLTTPLTCTATNWAILAMGLRPRWVDVDPRTCNVELDDLSSKLSEKTRAIMVVHWGGYPNDLARLATIQQECQLRFGTTPPIIEDCAHAWGSTYCGQPLGTHGNTCVYSFQAIKHLTCGDGGALVVPSDNLYRRGKLLRWYGIDRDGRSQFRCEENISEWGYKFHMNDINAAIGLANLRCAEWAIGRHQDNAKFYRASLAKVSGVTLLEEQPDRMSASWLFTLCVDRRDDFERRLSSHGVAANRVHERNDKHSCVEEFAATLPGMDQLQREMTCIPVGWWVTNEDRQRIVEIIHEGW